MIVRTHLSVQSKRSKKLTCLCLLVVETYKRLLDEERTTTRLQRQVINELQNDVQRLQKDRSNLAKFVQFKEKEHQSKLSSLQNELNQAQTFAEGNRYSLAMYIAYYSDNY